MAGFLVKKFRQFCNLSDYLGDKKERKNYKIIQKVEKVNGVNKSNYSCTFWSQLGNSMGLMN